jgi:hypothetical protein
MAISPEGRLYVYREQWWQKVKIEEYAGSQIFYDIENPKLSSPAKVLDDDRGHPNN